MGSDSFGTRFGVGRRKCRQKDLFIFFYISFSNCVQFRYDVKWITTLHYLLEDYMYNGPKQQFVIPVLCFDFLSFLMHSHRYM